MTSSALSETCSATLWLGAEGFVFRGASPGLDRHAGAVPCLVVALDREFTLHVGSAPAAARSALVPARVLHHLDARGGEIVSWYLDPASPAPRACRAAMRREHGPVALEHREQDKLVELGRALRPGGGPAAVVRWTGTATGPLPDEAPSPITALAAKLLADPAGHWPASACARLVGLSESAFLRAFVARTGTSFRRYRLWTRTLRAMHVLAGGENLTRAAAEAGFATPSHLSSTFHGLFGLTPTRMLSIGLTIVEDR